MNEASHNDWLWYHSRAKRKNKPIKEMLMDALKEHGWWLDGSPNGITLEH